MGLTDQFYSTLDQIGHFGPFQVSQIEFKLACNFCLRKKLSFYWPFQQYPAAGMLTHRF